MSDSDNTKSDKPPIPSGMFDPLFYNDTVREPIGNNPKDLSMSNVITVTIAGPTMIGKSAIYDVIEAALKEKGISITHGNLEDRERDRRVVGPHVDRILNEVKPTVRIVEVVTREFA